MPVVTAENELTLICTSRATFNRRFVYKRGGVLVNTTGFTGLFEIKAFSDSPLPLLSGTHLDYLQFTGVDGGVLVNIPSNVTEQFPFENAYYHLFITNPSTQITKRILHGPFVVNQT